MKKYIILIVSIVLLPVLFSSCLESYLDKSPEAGLTSDDVFKKLDNFKKFFLDVYEGRQNRPDVGGVYAWRDWNIKCGMPFYFDQWDQKYTWEGLTDCADMGRIMEGQTVKSGQVISIVNKFTYDPARRPILGSLFTCIRICNLTLQNIKLLQADQVVIDDYTAQAHFVRAFCHFELFRIWGPMPYLTKAMTADDVWDLPRLSKHETLLRVAADMDSAATFFAKANLMRRDNPVPGAPGHLTNTDQRMPNGVAAKAFKARALLYAASPLNNELGVKDWEVAAQANWEAITIAKQYGYDLLVAAKYKDNYVGTTYTNEQLWGYSYGGWAYNNGNQQGMVSGVIGNSASSWSGECPTQNFVDKFETKFGEPLNTQAERDAATAAGHYKEQDPYTNRDPRFYIDIIHNQATNMVGWTSSKAQIYYTMTNGVAVYAELINPAFLGITRTGYYSRKRWGENSVKNQTTKQITDPIIRLGELYLNYAEAANEAYGPKTAAPVAGAITAEDAINLIRTRIGQPNVFPQYTVSTATFRPRIKNERNIELCFEGHYYFDLRRWKDAPAAYAGPLMGVDIEKVAVTTTYPTGFKYTRYALSADRQINWKEPMYYLPFNTEDTYKMKNFVSNPVW
ncbi:MAG: RagB/SusD family nutrient uptake outer membrane protein [Bacteroidia bacterium]|nr:RagB/SusD family nutrient uptake outer membrane protein [Bacteroidia bacterium]